MPDIIVLGEPEYDKLTKSQKDLIQAIVKPEADALQEFIESDLEKTNKLEKLEEKYFNKTMSNINKLLNSGITKKQINLLILLLNDKKIEEIKEINDGYYPDVGDPLHHEIIDKVGFSCNYFEWTRRCLNKLVKIFTIQKRFRAYKEGNITRKSLGIFTEKQKENDWSQIKKSLEDEDFSKAEIDYFYQKHYLAKGKKKKNKKKSKKKRQSKKKKSKKK
jgi:hypothetical protein